MLFRIPARTFARLSRCCTIEEIDGKDDRRFLKGVLLERDDSLQVFAVASNGRIMAVEYLNYDVSGNPGETVTVIADTALVEKCRASDGSLVVTDGAVWIEENGIPVEFFDAALLVVPSQFTMWRKAVPRGRTDKHGVLTSNGFQFERLAQSSPSGWVIFEDWISEDGIALVNDPENPDWFGVFVGWLRQTPGGKKIPKTGAKLPKWIA